MGKRKFADKNMHIEFHNVDPKKSKAADCVYLDTYRICRNKKCPLYLAKCFVASACSYRLHQEEAERIEREQYLQRKVQMPNRKEKPKSKKQVLFKRINCTIPSNTHIFSNVLGQGSFAGYDAESRLLSVRFGDTVKRFKYPEAILEKHLIVPRFAFKQVLYDIYKAEKEEI